MKRLNALKKFGKQAAATSLLRCFLSCYGGEGGQLTVLRYRLIWCGNQNRRAGLVIVGITMALQSITLAKRAVNKA
ncbi:phage coat protein [Vibrio alginolyticus]|uniref:phage coat protein n=1 Tax=Vibrio alginolyticus TaxID=663 RepID=UPI001D04DEB2|nr:phage coat protein [Vibrio alginolyticus]